MAASPAGTVDGGSSELISAIPTVPLRLARIPRLQGGVELDGRVECGDEIVPDPVVDGDHGTVVQDLDRRRLARLEHELGA